MDENYYTPYEYFADEEDVSMIGPDGSAAMAWVYAGILCKRYSLTLEKHRRIPAQTLPLFSNLLFPIHSPLNPFSYGATSC